jgi:hypothetical protein
MSETGRVSNKTIRDNSKNGEWTSLVDGASYKDVAGTPSGSGFYQGGGGLTSLMDNPSAKAGKAAAGLISGAADVGIGVAGLVQNKKARDEARDMAHLTRADKLEQQATWQKLSDRQFENDEERFELEKKIVTDKNRFDLFFREIEKSKESSGNLNESIARAGQMAETNDQFKSVLLNMLKKRE